MASKQLAALAIFAIVLPTVAMATEFTVGDDQGWTINFDYEAWAKDKVFHVGDKTRKWYICGVNDHCANYGQKLAITVLEAWVSPASAPSTPAAPAPSSAYGISVSGYQLLMVAMVAVAFLVV
ncbi:hypothetical protein CK203_085681 [Vitis vinifera]|uniref:Phytocyanin domain-containing protein n=1 Tax=Vitis vinifera TaxID=29760 RepID=A0A438BLN7_VITVI|nr:hypothetical protein CK203_085681 [Vitis vinifera]